MREVLIEFGNSSNKHVFHIPKLKGYIHISQIDREHHPSYIVDVEGLTPHHLHGFHIHENPVTQASDLNMTCQSCGGHFNPFHTSHGSVFNQHPDERHAGDLINNICADASGKCYIRFVDKLTSLYPNDPECILDKSIVIHKDTDDLGRQGKTLDMPYIMEQDGKNNIVNQNNFNVELYKDRDKRKSSLENGNAGKRIACANILLSKKKK